MLDVLRSELANSFSTVPAEIAALRLLVALILGGIIGWEREARTKPAGLRTHMLIATAACLFILVAQELVNLPFAGSGEMRVDPLRLIEAVTAGVAFLAAGAIFTSKGEVKNITTGAGMWLAGAVGVAAGSGQLPLAVLATVVVVTVMSVVGWLERRYTDKG
ncbi:MgtC/SapB family protein [Brevirhabdus sp.]|uniref:MgtC/SapB family protein n=1 Tax=Brevirhabdus sp. TaxID=2004514 RepID=UPI0040587319